MVVCKQSKLTSLAGAIPLALIPGEATTSVAENSIETPAAEADVDTNNSGVVTPAEMPVPEITATNDVVAPGPSAPVSDSSVADVTPLASASTTASETIETEITVATASETADDASSTADEGAPVNGVGGKPSAAVGGLVAAIGALLFI